MINWLIELLMICQYRLDKTNHLLSKWREAIHSTRAATMRVRVDLIMKRLASIDGERSMLIDRLAKLTDNNGPQKVVYLDHLRYLSAQRINVVAQIAKVTGMKPHETFGPSYRWTGDWWINGDPNDKYVQRARSFYLEWLKEGKVA